MAITKHLCGHSSGATTVSRINAKLDEQLRALAERDLEAEYPYLVLVAHYERVREADVSRRRAVLIAAGVSSEGRRIILGVEIANRESFCSWKGLLLWLRQHCLRVVELVVSDPHQGLRQTIVECFPEVASQRCCAHFLRNALDRLPRKADDDCLQDLRWLYGCRDLREARTDLAA